MVAAGLTPYEALRTDTVNVAAYLGEANEAGTVETGKRADFILVADDPLEDIRSAAAVLGVFTHGKWHSAGDLESMLAQARAGGRAEGRVRHTHDRLRSYSPKLPAGPGNTTGLSEPSLATDDTPKK